MAGEEPSPFLKRLPAGVYGAQRRGGGSGLRVASPEGPHTLPMELGPKKNHPYFGFGDLIP